jgi:hypothetical protein
MWFKLGVDLGQNGTIRTAKIIEDSAGTESVSLMTGFR